MFAKLFGTDANQVLAVLDVDEDDAPEIRLYIKPPGLGLCHVGLKYKTEKAAEKAFSEMAEEHARAATRTLVESASFCSE